MMHLRRLLLGNEYGRLAAMREDVARVLALEEALRDPVRQTDDVARVLSEALLLRENQDQGVSKALRPAIADAFKAAVRKTPQPVVEAITPVIGPAIRRAVNDAIAGMLELLDKLLEHNLSWQALQWRIDAWRTGRRYSEVVLLRTLIYRVEQVLLIHRETGLLLQHVESPQAGLRDPDLIGGMLTAIKDFVADSFSANHESPVQTMQVGDHKVIIEQGRRVVIAAIARGNPPSELVRTIQETLETVEILHSEKLDRFDGDATPFSETRAALEDCLKSQQRTATGRRPGMAPALLALLLIALLGFWGVRSYQVHKVWAAALDALRTEPGILVTEAVSEGDVYLVSGLRDPLARDPEEVIGTEALSGLRWRWALRPYLSAEHDFLLARAKQALQPPPTVALSLHGGVLHASGEAPQQWIDAMQIAAPGIPGITGYRDEALVPVDPFDQRSELLAAALEALREEPGIFVSNVVRNGDVVHVQGLRDPLSRAPADVIGRKSPSGLKWKWELRPFLSTERDLLLARAKQALQAPATVALSLDGDVLQVSGEAPRQWVDAMHLAAPRIAGITAYRDDALNVIDDTARYRETLAQLRSEIQATMLHFDSNAVGLKQDQRGRLGTVAKAMKRLVPIAEALGLTPRYVVSGYADATGSRTRNRALSFSRARWVTEELVARGVGERLFFPSRMGVTVPTQSTHGPDEGTRNRRVTVDVMLLEDVVGAATR